MKIMYSLKKYNQKKNKTIACKVLALNQKDAETYLDGSCKNGKAAGLGKITYVQDGNVFERITDNKSKNQDGFSDFYARDYSKKLTIRGQIKNENSYGEEYLVIRETLEENPIKDEAFVFKEFVYHNMDYTIRKIYVPHFDAMFTLVDRKGLRYLRAEMNNPSINAPSMIEGIGKVTDGTLDTTVGMREIPRVSRYTVNGKKNIRSCSQRKQRNHFSRW